MTERLVPKLALRWWPILLFALLPILPLWRCVFLGEAIGPFDQIRQMAPWNGPKPAEPWDVLQADGVLQFYPWRDMVFKSWGRGQLPLWNPYELAGTPLLANSQSAGFYPPHILIGLLHLGTPLGMVILAWGHLFWAAAGTYLLCRRLGASRLGGFVAGASFELSVFVVAWTGLPSVIETVAWIPWVLAGTLGLLIGRRRNLLLLAFASGMMILAGHLQFAAYGFLAAAVFGGGMAWAMRIAWARIGALALGLVAGGLLAAPQLLPVLNYGQYSHRRNVPTPAGYEAYLGGAIKPFELANLANPYSLGSPRTPVEIGPDQSVGAYWPPFVKQGANFAESAVTLGPLLIGLLFLTPWRHRRTWPLAAMGIVALLLALGTVLNWPLYFLVPGWSSTGSPGRVICLFVLSVCVLASLGVTEEAASRRTWAIWATALVPLICMGFARTAGPSQPALDSIARSALAAAIPFTLAAAAVAGLAIAVAKVQRYRWVLGVAPVVLAAGYGGNLVITGPAIPIQPPASFSRTAIINGSWSLHLAAPALAPPNTAYLLGLHELGGYDSLLHRDSKALLDRIDGQDAAPPANGNMLFVKPTADWTKLIDAGVSDIWSRQPIPDHPADPDGVTRVHLVGPGRAGAAIIVAESFSGVTLRASGPGRLVLRDRNMPGWRASIDGKPTPVMGDLWREVALPPGNHTVRFDYAAPGLIAGMALGGPAWVVLAMASALAMRRKVSVADPGST